MAKAAPSSCVDRIGEMAGAVWRELEKNGPLSKTKLIEVTGEPRDAVMQAIGWLARENKICIEEQRRSRIISLR